MAQESQTKQPDETYCSNCRGVIKRDVKFCDQCGARVSAAPGAAPSTFPSWTGATAVSTMCPTCGVVTDARWFCRNCGEFLRAPGTGRVAGGLWRRFSAALLDVLFFYLLLIIGWFIWFAFTANQGQTPGKQLLGLRVISLDGTVAPPGTMWLREVVIKGVLGYWLTSYVGALGSYIWAFYDRERQTVHDKMVNTYVIHYPGPATSLTPVPLAPGEQFAPQARPGGPVEDVGATLRRLAQMRDQGLITNEEYEEKRRALVEKL